MGYKGVRPKGFRILRKCTTLGSYSELPSGGLHVHLEEPKMRTTKNVSKVSLALGIGVATLKNGRSSSELKKIA